MSQVIVLPTFIQSWPLILETQLNENLLNAEEFSFIFSLPPSLCMHKCVCMCFSPKVKHGKQNKETKDLLVKASQNGSAGRGIPREGR